MIKYIAAVVALFSSVSFATPKDEISLQVLTKGLSVYKSDSGLVAESIKDDGTLLLKSKNGTQTLRIKNCTDCFVGQYNGKIIVGEKSFMTNFLEFIEKLD